MSYELSQNGNVIFRGWTDSAVIQERLKRADELSAELERVKAERDALKASLNEIRNDLERIVCTEGEDAGVFFLSPESPSNYDPELNCHVYVHEHFSELGGALVNLYKTVVSEGGAG
jgi:cytolysin (calcineurin-like family phosphatase)